MHKLSDTIERKFIETIDVSDWEVETDTGWSDISQIHKTIEYQEFIVRTESGKELICADTHILFDHEYREVFADDLIPNKFLIMTKDGPELVTEVIETENYSNMYDLTLNDENHRFYTNDILSHNSTTTAAYLLWYVLFNSEKTVGLLANKGEIAREILGRVQLAYEQLPKWLQQGIVKWNEGSIELENNSRIIASATGANAARGYSFNVLFVDEAAFIENWDEFYSSVFPVVSSFQESKVILVSTPNGLNHFYSIYQNANNTGDKWNGYSPMKVTWDRVPGRDLEWMNTTLAAMNFDQDKFNQEFRAEFQGSSGTLISGQKLKELVSRRPLHDKSGLTEYYPPFPNRIYTCVADVSRGKGLDYSAFHIIDITEMPYMQVCTYRNNMITPHDYAGLIFRVCKAYNNATVLVELNDIGAMIPSILFHDFEYDNILYTENAGRAGKRISGGFNAGASLDKGINTTKTVKAMGCTLLKLLIEQNQLIINDFHTISELSTFSKKGKSYEAEEGKHDDLVMGLVLFAWLTDQDYFKEMTNLNTLDKLREKTDEEIESELTPFGFISDGEVSQFDEEVRRTGNWLFPELIDNYKGGDW
jgi:Terminase RNaseH-like domain/Terminase large subunit, T4likevirus-type, N-terminal